MPKCMECYNTTKFSYMENSYNEAEYNEAGELVDVVYKEFHDVTESTCMVCNSTDVKGEF